MPNTPPPPDRPQPMRKAAALEYDRAADAAPRLTARGRGAVADKILEVAAAHNLPVRSDADLMQILDRVEVGTEIPAEVYAVVAEIFAWLYKANQPSAHTPDAADPLVQLKPDPTP